MIFGTVIIKNLLQWLFLFSHYYGYVLELLAQSEYGLPYYKVCQLQCIEMAIWPLLYVKKEWCESNLSGKVSYIIFKITKNELLFVKINKISKYIP